jgi:hypothetical protein
LESFDLFYGNFCIDLYSVASDETMKRGNEALNASSLQFLSSVKRFIALSLKFFLSVKRFIAVTFYGTTSFNASSPLLFKRNSLFNASSPLLSKVTLPTFDEINGHQKKNLELMDLYHQTKIEWFYQ